MMRRLAAALMVMVVAAAAPGSEAHAQRRTVGTIFIGEIQAGYGIGAVFSEDPGGFTGRLTVGVGGKFSGWPTRIYGIANLGVGFYEGAFSASSGPVDTERVWRSWSVGVRLLTPLADNLRLLADLSLGQAIVTSHATILGGVERYTVDDDSLLVELGVGLQYRVAVALSLGARIEAAFPTNLDSFDLVTELAGGSSRDGGRVNPSFLVTATLHL